MTPLEVAEHPALWRQLFRTRQPPASQVKRFVRTEIAAGVILFSANSSAAALIVGFCGKGQRLLMPIAMMLQFLDDEKYDVLIVQDSRRLHFDQGIERFAATLPALANEILSIAKRRNYSSIVTYGTSMGGFPALRAGEYLGADRAVSAGGRFVWHMARFKKQTAPVGAFDPICNCRMPFRTPCYALFSSGKADDLEAADQLAAIMGRGHAIGLPSSEHNFPFRMYLKGKLTEYHREIFDLAREPDPAKLRALLE